MHFDNNSPHVSFLGINWTSPIQVMKSIDSTGEVVGSGACHQVSQQHLDLRQAMFRQLHTQLVSYEKKDPAPNPMSVQVCMIEIFVLSPFYSFLCCLRSDMGFHFLFPGRMMPQGAELSQGIDSGTPHPKIPQTNLEITFCTIQ